MKSLIISIIIAAGIVGGSLAYSEYIDGLSEQLCAYGDDIKELLADEDFPKAAEELSSLSDFIESKKLSLASTTDHNNIDNIERNIAELKAYTAGGQKYDALAKCELLNALFEHLPKNYTVNLENIL